MCLHQAAGAGISAQLPLPLPTAKCEVARKWEAQRGALATHLQPSHGRHRKLIRELRAFRTSDRKPGQL